MSEAGENTTRERIQRTWVVTTATAERVSELADRLAVGDSLLVDRLLRFALDAVDAGRLVLHRRAVRWEIVDE